MPIIQYSMGDREMLQRFQDQLEIKQRELHQAEARLKESRGRLSKASEDVREDEREVGSLRIMIKNIGENIDSLIDT